MIPKVKAVTFDDFLTLRYPMKQREDIIYPILTALRRKLDVNEEQFLKQYFKENQLYQKKLRKTLSPISDFLSTVFTFLPSSTLNTNPNSYFRFSYSFSAK
jgi:hypothetical protein